MDLQDSAEHLFAEALDVPPERRAAFLDGACRGAAEMRRLVDELLRDHERAGSFLEQPLVSSPSPSDVTAAQTRSNASRFQAGQRIANRFLVVRFLARGGMGEVYEVQDELLHASLALKIIRPEIAGDETTSSRFKQEVILARKVVHPNLCPIYEISHCDQPPPAFLFLTMKLLRGETLDARLRSETSPDAVEAEQICSQLLSGVAALHAARIIHRDLKPNNVMLEREEDGLNVSIMDFGLARLNQAEASLLGTGMIAGTPGYMAPELLRGERPTRATDIYALGVVLHQVLTGARPVESERGLSVTPSPALVSGRFSPRWAQAVGDFLSPEPQIRTTAFERLWATQATTQAGSTTRFRRADLPWLLGLSLLAIVAVLIAMFLIPASSSGPLESTQITFSAQPREGPLFTDGVRLYLESRGVPSEMALSGGTIAPTRLVDAGMRLMDISPDGARVLEWKPELGRYPESGSLWVATSQGGTPRRVGNYLVNTPDWRPASWSRDGHSIVFTDERTLYRADADGTNVKKLWEAPRPMDGVCTSPDGTELTVAVWDPLHPSRLWRLQGNGEGAHLLLADWPPDSEQWGAQWTPDGHHFTFLSDRDGRPNVYELIAPRWFEFWKKPAAVRITGNQVPILATVTARDSRSLFVLQRTEQGAMQAWNPHTRKLEPFLGGLPANQFVISPDRQWMAYTEWLTGFLWRSRLDGSEPLQLTNSLGMMELWSPDSKSIVYADGIRDLIRIGVDGGTPEVLTPVAEPSAWSALIKYSPTWIADGKAIAFSYFDISKESPDGVFVLDLASRKVSRLTGSEGMHQPQSSPDGAMLVAYTNKEARMMLYSVQTKTWTELVKFQAPAGARRWANDSKSVFLSMSQGNNGLYRIAVPEGTMEKLTDLSGGYGQVTNGDSEVSVTADGQPAMMSRTGVAQIFQLHWKQ